MVIEKEILCGLLFLSVCGLLMTGFPVAFTLAGTALIFAGLSWLVGVFDPAFIAALPQRIYGQAMINEVLLAVPMFIFMGVTLERSKVAEELLQTMGIMLGALRGGLGIAVCLVGALLAASTGIVGATVVTMGLLSLPTMLRYGYDPRLATGVIAASGTLGQIIPPSIVLIVLGDQISNAYVNAQRELGNWSPEPVSVGDLFAGSLLPGLGLVGLYMLYTYFVAVFRPAAAPPIPRSELPDGGSLAGQIARVLVPPMILIVAVLGSILAGIATPTEAAAVGAVGALMLAGLRLSDANPLPIYVGAAGTILALVLTGFMDLRVGRTETPTGDLFGIVFALAATAGIAWGLVTAIWRIHKAGVLVPIMQSGMQVTAMVFVIVIGAAMFSLIFRALGGDDMVHHFLTNLPGGAVAAMVLVMATMFILGFFLDFLEIAFVVVPIVAPILLLFDLNPIWLGVMMAMNLQTSFLTPPFGFALFYLRGVAPPQVTTQHIYKGIIPFVIIQLVALGILAMVPDLATWLPRVIFGSFAEGG
ncbi:MAG: TRAP transporter large permease subunit [Alphaproteobacteria bacterium]